MSPSQDSGNGLSHTSDERDLAVFVPGLAHGGSSMRNLARFMNDKTELFFAVPSRGDVDATLERYASDLDKYLSAQRSVQISTIVCHSMGAFVVQLLQKKLLEEGTTMAEKFGITKVLSLASSIPGDLDWAAADSDSLAQQAGGFVNETNLKIPDGVFAVLFFAPPDSVVPAASKEVIDETSTYNVAEPLNVASQLVSGKAVRPCVPEGAFAAENGTTWVTVALEQDRFVRPDELRKLHMHLTRTSKGFFVIRGELSVHNLHISHPELLRDAIEFMRHPHNGNGAHGMH